MDLITILIVLIVCGGLVFLIGLLPIDATYKLVAKVVVAIFVIVWVLEHLRGANIHI